MDGTAPAKIANAPLDFTAFARDLDSVRATVAPFRDATDFRALRSLAIACQVAVLAGLGLSIWGLNPLSPLLLALAASTRWMVLGHHLCHGALDGVPGVPDHWQSSGYARGWRRWLYWPDWIDPDAWHREHNQLHHAYTNEAADPDVPSRQSVWLQQANWPLWCKSLVLLVIAANWRWVYYAPNTAACAVDGNARLRDSQAALIDRAAPERLWSPLSPAGAYLWRRSWLPYCAFTFGLLPLLVAPFGWQASLWALVHLLIAEVVCALHTFAVIVPNHAGDDLLTFTDRARGKGHWYWRQIRASCNYATGGLVNDWLHGWLNYQIEHHLWPDLTPRQYARLAPLVREVCARHGVPYVQQSIWRRVNVLRRVLTGA